MVEKQTRGILLIYLRDWRQSKGLTQRELSERTGPERPVPHSHISRIESLNQHVFPSTIRKLAAALGITDEQLINTSPMSTMNER